MQNTPAWTIVFDLNLIWTTKTIFASVGKNAQLALIKFPSLVELHRLYKL